jgi:Flp pilus assembly protein TadB
MTPLFTETAGRVMLVGGAILETFGIILIRRILAIEV